MKNFEIDTFIARDHVADIHHRFFNEDSEQDIEYLFSLLYCYDIMKPKQLKKLQKKMYAIEKIMKEAIHDFELKQLKQLKR